MFETGRGKTLPGYMGHVPGNWQEEQVAGKAPPRSHIPNYAGFIKGAKAENFIGQTYGKMTYVSSTGEYAKGRDLDANTKYKSVARENHIDVNQVVDKTAGEMLGVQPKYEAPPTIIPVETANKFWGVPSDDNVALQKNTDAFYANTGTYNAPAATQSLEDAQKSFFGKQNKSKPEKHGEPVPGYTGVSRRVGADNIFGQSYAASRKTSKEVLRDSKAEGAQILQQRAKFVPDYMKVDVGNYEGYLQGLKPSPLDRDATPDAAPAQNDPRIPSAEANAFFGTQETESDQLARNTNAFYGKAN